VLLNLLSNAVKFTPSGSVTLFAGKEQDSLVFKVVDTGIGMSEEQLARLFLPFEQADGSTTRKFGGTGLGLAISKRIIELLGGSIRVDSALNRGSSFEVRLPYSPIAQGEADEEDSTQQLTEGGMPLLGLRILVAEDNTINQQIIAENLKEDGAEVVLADTGLEALEAVRKEGGQAFHIVLMDIQMPVMNGHEATREIHKLAPDLPVVGQTAHAFAEEVQACMESGMVGHIGKPIDPEKLVQIVLLHARRS
jgi:CheY-like chemotaxis protein